jgi:hypothetical protein
LAVLRLITSSAGPTEKGPNHYGQGLKLVQCCRQLFAGWVGCTPSDIGLTPNPEVCSAERGNFSWPMTSALNGAFRIILMCLRLQISRFRSSGPRLCAGAKRARNLRSGRPWSCPGRR